MPSVRSRFSYNSQSPIMPEDQSRRPSGLVIGVVVLVVLAIIGGTVYFFFWRGGGSLAPTNEVGNQQQVADLIGDVGKLIDLPAGETPTIATVNNLEALSGQEFFKRAELGDKVLIYPQARKAILYSPTKNKIIEVAPLNIPADNAASADLQKDIPDSL